MSVVLASCNGRAIDTFCLNSRPIYPTKAEVQVMTDETVEKVLRHNEFGRKECGWEIKRTK